MVSNPNGVNLHADENWAEYEASLVSNPNGVNLHSWDTANGGKSPEFQTPTG